MEKYSVSMRIFHWLVGSIIIILLAIGYTMTSMTDDATKWQVYNLHKSMGVLVLALVLFRILNRLRSSLPSTEVGPLETKIASLNYFLFYVLLFVIPFSGYSMSAFLGYKVEFFGLMTIPNIYPHNLEMSKICKIIHETSTTSILVLLALHIAGFLKHFIIDKKNLLKRMV